MLWKPWLNDRIKTWIKLKKKKNSDFLHEWAACCDLPSYVSTKEQLIMINNKDQCIVWKYQGVKG